MNNVLSEKDDFIAEGFYKIDENLITKRPPKIKWGMKYTNKSANEKIKYLEKLASSMNHAAYLVQEERNELGILCEKKERQIESMAKSLCDNNTMIQQEITRMNSDRQYYNKQIALLNAKLGEFKGGNKY